MSAGLVGVINYGAGNLGSVMNALGRLGVAARFIAGPEELAGTSPFEKIIFPGDGHFATAMEALEKSGYAEALHEWIALDRPFLGICIGLQLLFERSEEAPGAAGLGVIPGEVRHFPGRKVPQIGWNETSARPGAKLFRGLPPQSFFYFIHSYYAAPAETGVIAAETDYGLRYCSALERGNLAAVQFHPEKSGKAGLRLLENWLY
jgi:imidazole glycerol phosphate synthase glutamine amidotransferase subunit